MVTTGSPKLLLHAEFVDVSCEVASKRTGLQPYLIPSKVNLTMHPPNGGFTGIIISWMECKKYRSLKW